MHGKLTSRSSSKRAVRGRRTRAGLTLTEVIVASALLAVAIVPILKALAIAQVTGRIVERKTHSLMLAQGKLDEIRAQSVYHYGDSLAESSTSLSGAYLCTVSDDQDPDLRTVSVSVGYDANGDTSLGSDEILVTLMSYVAKRWPGT